MAAEDLLGQRIYDPLPDDEEPLTPANEEEKEQIELEILREIDNCQSRDLKWFTIATTSTICLLIIVNVPLLHFVPHYHWDSLNNLFII